MIRPLSNDLRERIVTAVLGGASSREAASANHRFFTEDVPYGLMFLRSLGEMQGIAMPICDTIITMSSVICDTDFRKNTPFDLTQNRALADLVLEYRVRSAVVSQPQQAAIAKDGTALERNAGAKQSQDIPTTATAAERGQGQRTPEERRTALREELEAADAKKTQSPKDGRSR